MEVSNFKIAKVFSSGGDIHYVLPLFQREYTWERSNWNTLLTDLGAIHDEYVGDKVPEHFMGSLVVVEDGFRSGVIPAFRLVDGQQRLTTISLVLCALGRLVQQSHPAITSRIKKLLLNQDETGDVRYKLLPTTKYGDRAFYTALLDQAELPQVESRIADAYTYLHRELERKLASGELDAERLFVIITTSLQVVLINLNSKESPYQIFESLNAKGKPLTQADLVRNYIAMKVAAQDQETLYARHWAPIEALLQEQRMVGRSGLGELTAFLRHYLAMHSGVLANQEHVYARFRDRIEAEFKAPGEIAQELATLHRFALYYARFLRPEIEADKSIRNALERLNTMDAATAYPFLLAVFDARDAGSISKADFQGALTTLENYLVRRYLAGEAINYQTKMFPTLWRALNTEAFISSLEAALAARNYPSDHRIRQAVLSRPFYENKSGSRDKLVLVLSSLNNHLSRFEEVDQVLRGAATIEHVLPQTPPADWKEKWKIELGPDWEQFHADYMEWQAELGEDWEQTYRDHLHTLGNLTLVTQRWQIKLSNKPFAIKKNLLVRQGLNLNKYFGQEIPRWDETAIVARANALVNDILEVWPALALPAVAGAAGDDDSGAREGSARRNWDEASTLGLLEAKRGRQEVEIARKIMEWAQSQSVWIWWSQNSTEGSFVPYFFHLGIEHQLFVVRASGVVELYFQWYQNKQPFASQDKRLELLRRLNAIPGLSLPVAVITRRPTFPIALLQNEDALAQFLAVFEWFVAQVRQVEATSGPARLNRDDDEGDDDENSSVPSGQNSFAPSSLPQLQLSYWTAFCEHIRQEGSFLKPRTPAPQKWMAFAIGRSYFDTIAEISAADNTIHVSLNISGPDRLHEFDRLYLERDAIEAEIGPLADVELVWGRLPDKKICRIRLTRPHMRLADRDSWSDQHQWLLSELEALHKAFVPHI